MKFRCLLGSAVLVVRRMSQQPDHPDMAPVNQDVTLAPPAQRLPARDRLLRRRRRARRCRTATSSRSPTSTTASPSTSNKIEIGAERRLAPHERLPPEHRRAARPDEPEHRPQGSERRRHRRRSSSAERHGPLLQQLQLGRLAARGQLPDPVARRQRQQQLRRSSCPTNVGYKFTPGEILMLQIALRERHHADDARPRQGDRQLQPDDRHHQRPGARHRCSPPSRSSRSARTTRRRASPASATSTPTTPITIVAANGHFHSRGTDFTICHLGRHLAPTPARRPQFYESTTWNEPPMMTGLNVAVPAARCERHEGLRRRHLDLQLPVGAVAGVRRRLLVPQAAQDDRADRPAATTSAASSRPREHCNAFVYYYPKVAKTDIVCQ